MLSQTHKQLNTELLKCLALSTQASIKNYHQHISKDNNTITQDKRFRYQSTVCRKVNI